MADRKLHLVGGETAREKVAAAGIPGEIHSIDDILMDGPVENGLSSDSDWQFRARVVEQTYGVPADRYLATKVSRDRLLSGIVNFEETVFWFEQCVFCQINFIYFFSYIAKLAPLSTVLSIAANTDEPVGHMNVEQIRALFEQRRPLSGELLQLSKAAWAAYSARDPRELARFVKQQDFSAWPELRRGLELHLKRFPGETGLNFLETSMLKYIKAAGPSGASVADLVCCFWDDRHTREYGLSDVQIIAQLKNMTESPIALVAATSSGPHSPGGDLMRALALRAHPDAPAAPEPMNTKFVLTNDGRALLAGERSEEFKHQSARWIGGVHVHNGVGWRLDQLGLGSSD
jgi:hypothetical protein